MDIFVELKPKFHKIARLNLQPDIYLMQLITICIKYFYNVMIFLPILQLCW